MALVTATNIQIKNYQNGVQNTPESGWNDASDGYYYTGKVADNNNCVTVIKFTIDSNADAIKLDLTTYSKVSANSMLNYAIFSYENIEYNNVDSLTIGEGQLKMPDSTFTTSTYRLFKSLSAGTHYVYLWTAREDAYNYSSIYQPSISHGSYADFADTISIRNYIDGDEYDYWTDLGTKITNAGWGINNHNWVSIFRFVLPENVKNVKFSACVYEPNTSANATVRYKIVSGSEDNSLNNADINTPADGTFTLPTGYGDFARFSFNINKYVSKGATYLYIWGNKEIGTHNTLGIRGMPSDSIYSTTIEYEPINSIIYIDNGISFDAYEAYIDNGESWDLYEVYIDNGNNWDLMG